MFCVQTNQERNNCEKDRIEEVKMFVWADKKRENLLCMEKKTAESVSVYTLELDMSSEHWMYKKEEVW